MYYEPILKTMRPFLVLLLYCFCLISNGNTLFCCLQKQSPLPADTFCHDTTVCAQSNPFNLNLLCYPTGGVYYGSDAILGDQFNPIVASIGANYVHHGFINGEDTVLLCTLTVYVVDTAFPSGEITGANSVCHGNIEEYMVPLIPNANHYLWNYSGANILDSLTDAPRLTLHFEQSYISGYLSVKGINDVCSVPGVASDEFFINVHERPLPKIRNISNNISLSDTVCLNTRNKYFIEDEYNNYMWHVQNGKIIGNKHLKEISVDWDSISGPGLISVEVNDQYNCSGSSNREVYIRSKVAPSPSYIWLFGYNMLVCSDSTATTYQWYSENTPIIGATSRYYLADTSNINNYFVQTCFEECCNLSNPFTFYKLATHPEIYSKTCSFFPNPFKDHLTIQLVPIYKSIVSFSLYNSLGVAVANRLITDHETQVHTSKLPPGIYILRLFSKSSAVGTYKLLKL